MVLVVMALGGDVAHMRAEAARSVAALAVDHHLVLACGWGPHAAVESLHDSVVAEVPTYPLEVLDSEAEQAAGHLFEGAIARRLPAGGLATVVGRVVVDVDDPAFAQPETAIGHLFDFPEADRLARAHGWAIAPDPGGVGWRHVMASPRPRAIAELGTFRILVDGGVTVLWPVHATLPVVRTPGGTLRRVEAAVDTGLAAAQLAVELDADALVLVSCTGDDGEAGSAGTDGSESVRWFVDQGGWIGAIAGLSDVAAVLRGEPAAMVWGPGAGVALA